MCLQIYLFNFCYCFFWSKWRLVQLQALIQTFTQVSNHFPDILALSQSYEFLHTPVLQHNKTVDVKVTGSQTSDPSPFTCSLTPTSSQRRAGISWLILINVLWLGETLKSVGQVVHLSGLRSYSLHDCRYDIVPVEGTHHPFFLIFLVRTSVYCNAVLKSFAQIYFTLKSYKKILSNMFVNVLLKTYWASNLQQFIRMYIKMKKNNCI